MNRRTNGEVARLRVEGELVDVHLAGADDLQVLLRDDHPIVGHVNVRVMSGIVLVYPESTRLTACLWSV